MVAEAVGELRPARRHMQRLLLAVAPHNDGHRHIWIETHRLLHVLETMNRPAINLENDVARANPTLLGSAARLNLPDFGRRERLAVGHEQNCQGGNRKDEIRRRPRGDDRGTLAQSLVMKRDVSFGLAEAREASGRQARAGIVVTEHLYVAAERDRAEFPAGSGAIPPAEQLRSEADRKHFDAHPVPARNYVVAELVDKHEHRENDHEPQRGIKQTMELGQPLEEFDHDKSVRAVNGVELRRLENLAAVSRAVLSKL